MGRKIKGKKHHGTKDPEKQRQVREDKIKMKINNRPSTEDFQELPKSMRMLMKSRDDVKQGNVSQRQRKLKDADSKDLLDSSKFNALQEPLQKGMDKPLKPVPIFKQKPGEHKRAFYYRIDQTIQSMKKRAAFEEKYKVDVQMHSTGETKIVDREMDEVEKDVEKKRIDKLAKKGIVVRTKEEKRKAKQLKEKQRKMKKSGKTEEDFDENFESFKDEVKFGERVDAPPTIKLSKFTPSSKPGAKKLLLHKTLNQGSKIKKNTKSMAKKHAMEMERQKAVELYRQLKANK